MSYIPQPFIKNVVFDTDASKFVETETLNLYIINFHDFSVYTERTYIIIICITGL